MHRKKYIWGTFLFLLLFVSPLPASAQTLVIAPPIRTGNSAPPALPSKTYSFSQVWTLIEKYQHNTPGHFSPELVACLMWEESGFRLVENPQSHALGFGQVMPSTVNAINRRYKTAFTRQQILDSPDASVEVTLRALELAYDWKKTKLGALVAYAGGVRNFAAVHRWVSAEPKMLQVRWMDVSATPADQTGASLQMVQAMQICSQPGFDTRRVF